MQQSLSIILGEWFNLSLEALGNWMERTLKLLFQRKTPFRQAAIGDLSVRDRIFPRSRRLRGVTRVTKATPWWRQYYWLCQRWGIQLRPGVIAGKSPPSNRLFNTPIMVNPSADHEKQPARPYKCPYPLCGRAFSRLEHQVPLLSLWPIQLAYHPLDKTHSNSHRRKTLHLYLSLLRETLFPLGRTHSSLSYTQQWSSSESPSTSNIF